MDYQDYAQELSENAHGFKELAFEYKKERASYAEALNGLTVLIWKADLHDDKASFENKLIKLLATPYTKEAQPLIEQFNTSRANYKGLEMVLEAYKAQISAIQSVIKYNLQGELAEAVKNKVANFDETQQYY